MKKKLLEDKIGEIFPSPLYHVRKEMPMEKIVHNQPSHGKRQQHLVVYVYGRTSEAICTYHGCDHKLSVHGIGSCKCKHPTNKTLGVFTKYP